ncbi:MAG: acetylornithine deacetylase [Acidobacteriaceae bacterium]
MTSDLSPATLLRELIRIPSVSSLSNRPMVEFAKNILAPRGWRIHELPYRDTNGNEKLNAIVTPPRQKAKDFSVDLAFVCHTDTVPYSPAWADALEPTLREGALHGCGACDVKGYLACLLAVLTSAPAEKFAHSVALVLTAEEEIGCIGTKNLLAANLLQARHVLIGEPTSLYPARAGKGYNLAEIRVLGKEAHSAHPAQGVSAIFRAARFIEAIETLAGSLQHASQGETCLLFDPPYTTLNIGTIQGGTAKNIVPAECKFLLEWRSVPGETGEMVIPAVLRIAEELQLNDPEFSCEVEVLRQQAGFETAEDSPLLRRWVQLSGRPPIGVSFGTEAPLMHALTKDVVVVGPGDMRTAHSERECVPIDELDQGVSYLRALLMHPLLELR